MKNILGLIVDTFWCGSGNVSRGLHELGPNYMVDACCRTHDLCPIYIEPSQYKGGFRNNGLFTVVSCDCDNAFYNCLNYVNTFSSLAVIEAYSITYPTCVRPRIVCQSPDNNYDNNPCKGYRSSDPNLCSSENQCKIYNLTDQFILADSQFKKHQQRLDQQKQLATTLRNNEEQNAMFHHSQLPPTLFEPVVWQLINSSP